MGGGCCRTGMHTQIDYMYTQGTSLRIMNENLPSFVSQKGVHVCNCGQVEPTDTWAQWTSSFLESKICSMFSVSKWPKPT